MSDIEQRGAAALDKLASEKKKPRGKKPLRLVKNGGETFDPVGKRVIRHVPGQLPEILDQVGQSLADHHLDVFSYTTRLVRIYPATEKARSGVDRPRGALVLHTVDQSHLAELATAAATHEHVVRGGLEGP